MIIVLVGATATGKSALAVELAKRFNAEIISGDSIQVYRQLNIGSAKITTDEMQNIPHYFIDYMDYTESYNVKIFQTVGREYIKDIMSRNKNVIICGGTGLYIKALLYDYIFEEESIALPESYYLKSNEELYEMLQKVDEQSCVSIHPNNRKRILRALKIALSGETKSQRIAKQEHKMLFDAIIIGLDAPRDFLYERINQRVDLMLQQGLFEEVKSLYYPGVFSLQSMQGIGYKEWQGYFENNQSLADVIEKIKTNTRHLAKRQYTFFNNQFNIKYFSILDDYKQQIINYIEEKTHE